MMNLYKISRKILIFLFKNHERCNIEDLRAPHMSAYDWISKYWHYSEEC
jgi:hypothetical protein